MNRRVRVGSTYYFDPVPLDQFDSKVNDLEKGSKVKVINLPMAPKANTMGQCYIEDMSGNFLGMVCTNSLVPAKEWEAAQNEIQKGKSSVG